MSQILVTGEAKIRDIQGPVVSNSGVITALDGEASQYVRGDGTLADFPTSTGGGSSVSYYLNSSVSQGTIGGVAYRQLGKTPIIGAGTDIAISSNGYVASYITDANDPALLEVPAGNFNCEFYFSVNSNAHNSFVYAEVYKYDGTTFTLLGTSVGVPEYLSNGTTLSPYYFAVPVSTSVLTVTDRISIRIYVNVDGRTVTLHTENGHLCQVVTTFSKGLISLNNLTRQNQFFATGSSGTDFAISSSVATHTFNLPVASAANTGKLSSTDWSTFNNKQATLSFTAPLVNTSNTISIPAATSLVDGYLDNLDWVKFNTAYNDSIISAAVTGTTTKTLTLNQQDGGTITASWTDDNTDAVTSVFGRTGAVVATSGDYTTTQVTEGTNLYYTDVRARASNSFVAGSGAYNSTTGVITIPTNNNQITNGAAYITLGSLSATSPIFYNSTTGVISSQAASATLSGYLTSTDWTTFNSKGSGSVTSVAMSVPTGLSISGSPITTSGTLAVTFTAGYSIPTNASQTTWDTAYTNRITSLTVTGSSGSATLVSNVLNIPTYTLAGLGGQPLATNLTSVAGLTYVSTSFVKMTAAGTFTLDTTSYGTGTVTSVAALTLGTTGTDLSSSVANSTTTPVITLNVPTASATNRGALSSADWTTFNGKESVLTFSSPLVRTTNTISIPVATTSVNGYLSSTDWTTFNAKQNAITLTTTGTSGAATLVGATLNIPQYQGVLTNPVTGTGTTNTLPKFTAASTIGNSNITDSGTLITLGSNSYLNGNVGIGSTPSTNIGLLVSRNITGGVTSYGTYSNGTIQSDVTTNATFNATFIGTAAASFTVNNVYGHYVAGTTIGAGSAISTQQAYYAHSNFTGATNNYGFRGAIPSGTNRWNIYMDGTAGNYMAGSLGIGTTGITGINLSVSKNLTGATDVYGIFNGGNIQSDVTSSARIMQTNAATAAASFTISNIYHYFANQSTFGAGSVVTNQYGFFVQSNLIGATNNYGFRGAIPSGTNRWNLYMDGTANNYLAGKLLIGSTTDSGELLQVSGITKTTGLSLSGTTVSTSQTMTSSYYMWIFNGGSGQTLTLYSSSGHNNTHFIKNSSANSLTLAATNIETLTSTTVVGSITIPAYKTVMVISNGGSVWIVMNQS